VGGEIEITSPSAKIWDGEKMIVRDKEWGKKITEDTIDDALEEMFQLER